MSDFTERLKREVIKSHGTETGDWSRAFFAIDYLYSRGLIVADGFVVVPKAPSEKQIDAALEYCDGYNSKYFMGLYKAMITAAKED